MQLNLAHLMTAKATDRLIGALRLSTSRLGSALARARNAVRVSIPCVSANPSFSFAGNRPEQAEQYKRDTWYGRKWNIRGWLQAQVAAGAA